MTYLLSPTFAVKTTSNYQVAHYRHNKNTKITTLEQKIVKEKKCHNDNKDRTTNEFL